jgi:hypothetical protein
MSFSSASFRGGRTAKLGAMATLESAGSAVVVGADLFDTSGSADAADPVYSVLLDGHGGHVHKYSGSQVKSTPNERNSPKPDDRWTGKRSSAGTDDQQDTDPIPDQEPKVGFAAVVAPDRRGQIRRGVNPSRLKQNSTVLSKY